MEITLKLPQENVLAIIQVLGQLPTSSNAFPLMVDIQTQLQSQTSAIEESVT